MRIYRNFKESASEIKRDLAEMGILIHTISYQDKDIRDNPDFESFELQNYIYTVTEPRVEDLDPSQPWADLEFIERMTPNINPGEAWKYRPDIWEQFLRCPKDCSGHEKIGFCGPEDCSGSIFDYTYSERIHLFNQLDQIVWVLGKDPMSRQAFLSIWSPEDCQGMGGVRRIPCSLGYQFQIRRGALNITYLQRSSDFSTHFENDVFMAHQLQVEVARRLEVPVGMYTHWIGSLHLFRKDAKGVF